jgi:hypothetical protein
MERLAERTFVQAFRLYLRRGDEGAKRALRRAIPRRGEWFLCEVDGQDYAVRVLYNGRIEVMENIFDAMRSRAQAQELSLF